MTATEIMERQSEKAVLLGPQVDRLIQEGLLKVFGVVSDIADKANRLPPPPQILIDSIEEGKRSGGRVAKIDIRFTGPLAQAQQQLFNMRPIKAALNELGQASVLYPKVLQKVDEDKLAEAILDANNFPSDLIRSDDEIEAIRAAEAQMLAQQQAQEQLQGMADAVPKLNKKTEEGSPLEALEGALG